MVHTHPITGKRFDERALTTRQFALLVALASSGMLFGALMLSYFLARARTPAWPPLGTEPIPPLLPLLSFPVLAGVSLCLHLAWKKWLVGSFASFRKLWLAATVLGTLFLALQVGLWFDLSRLGIHIDSNMFSSVVWVLTAVHATHVVVAVALLWRLLVKTSTPARAAELRPESPRLVGYFWHFLDAIWVFLVVSVLW